MSDTNSTDKPDFQTALDRFLKSAQEVCDQYIKDNNFSFKTVLELQPGKRYIRVVRHDDYNGERRENSGSCYCFVDMTNGNILKSASWKAPAKHARGNIYQNADNGYGGWLTPYGAKYLR